MLTSLKVGLSKTNSSLFATGIYGTVKVVATGIFLIIGIDCWGRRNSLVFGSAWMASMMFIIGAVLVTHPPDAKATSVSSASIAMVAMIYLYVIGYSASWGPTPWVYLGEVRCVVFLHDLFLHDLFFLANDVSFRYSPLVFAPTVLALEQPHSGCSTLSSLRSLPRPSTTLDGGLSLCLGSSVLLWVFL